MSLSLEGGRKGQIQLQAVTGTVQVPCRWGKLGLFLPRPRGRYNKVVFRLIDSGISSHGQGVEGYTSRFKNYLCYRLVFKILASGMFVFYELSYRQANPQRCITCTNFF